MDDKSNTQIAVLICDDVKERSNKLNAILSKNYNVFIASSFDESFDLLRKNNSILCLFAGYEMFKSNPQEIERIYKTCKTEYHVPLVIIMNMESVNTYSSFLDENTDDVVFYPFSSSVVAKRLINVISSFSAVKQNLFLENLKENVEFSRKSESTGIFNRKAFLLDARSFIRMNNDVPLVVLRINVSRFSTYNEIYGIKAGDILLRNIGKFLERHLKDRQYPYGHWQDDNFVCILKQSDLNDIDLNKEITDFAKNVSPDVQINVQVGLYKIADNLVDISKMVDYAFLALKTIKSDITKKYAFYDETLKKNILKEQFVINSIDEAIAKDEFTIYYQPQVDYVNNTVFGCEALTRWAHPEKGLIQPKDFIPVFESSGLITKFDLYVWERVCKDICEWRGNKIPLVPVSINISRNNIYLQNGFISKVFDNLLKKYSILKKYIILEITESAYIENPGQLIATINDLKRSGYNVEMDDFGSGYSSLNTLKDLDFDTIKLDMKFLSKSNVDWKSGTILTSVVRMAKWLKMNVIAEGVETKENAEFLKSIGCYFMQGYYFSMPLPKEEFTKFICKNKLELENTYYFSSDIEKAENFLSGTTQANLMFNSFVGGAAILEYDGKSLEIIRCNDQFYKTLNASESDYAPYLNNIFNRFNEKNKKIYKKALDIGFKTHKEVDFVLESKGFTSKEPVIYTHSRIRYLAGHEGFSIYYLSVENTTREITLNKENKELSVKLSAIINNIPAGIADLKIDQDKNVTVEYCNEEGRLLTGYPAKTFKELFYDNFTFSIIDSDKQTYLDYIGSIYDGKIDSGFVNFQIVLFNGKTRYIRQYSRVTRRTDKFVHISAIMLNMDNLEETRQHEISQQNRIKDLEMKLDNFYKSLPNLIMTFEENACGSNIFYVKYYNDATWQFLGFNSSNDFASFAQHNNILNFVHPLDAEIFKTKYNELLHGKEKTISLDFRVITNLNETKWVNMTMNITSNSQSIRELQLISIDISSYLDETDNKLYDFFSHNNKELFEVDMATSAVVRYSISNETNKRFFERNGIKTVLETFIAGLGEDEKEKATSFFSQENITSTKGYSSLNLDFYSKEMDKFIIVQCGLLRTSNSHLFILFEDITTKDFKDKTKYQEEKIDILNEGLKFEDIRNRLIVENTGVLLFSYSFSFDLLSIKYQDSLMGYKQLDISHFFENLYDNKNISIEDRRVLEKIIQELKINPHRGSLQIRMSINDQPMVAYLVQFDVFNDENHKPIMIVADGTLVDSKCSTIIDKASRISNKVYDQKQQIDYLLLEQVISQFSKLRSKENIIDSILRLVSKNYDIYHISIIFDDGNKKSFSSSKFRFSSKENDDDSNWVYHQEYDGGNEANYLKLFTNGSYFICDALHPCYGWIRKTIAKYHITNQIQTIIRRNDIVLGYLVVDDDKIMRTWSKTTLNTLLIISDLLGVLLCNNMPATIYDTTNEFKRIFDKTPFYFYIIEPDTYDLIYLNQNLRENLGLEKAAGKCYEKIAGSSEPCADCPLNKKTNFDFSIPKIYNINGRRYFMVKNECYLNNNIYMAVYAIPEGLNFGNEKVSMLEDTVSYLSFAGHFDEIFEIDFENDTLKFLVSPFTDSNNETRPLRETVSFFADRFVADEDKEKVKKFYNVDKIRSNNFNNVPNTLLYKAFNKPGRKIFMKADLFHINGSRYLVCNVDITSYLNKYRITTESEEVIDERLSLLLSTQSLGLLELNLLEHSSFSSLNIKKYYFSKTNLDEFDLNKTAPICVFPEDLSLLETAIDQCRTNDSAIETTIRLRLIDGTYQYTKLKILAFKNKEQKIEKVIVAFTDVNEATKNLMKVKDLQDNLDNIISNVPAGIGLYEIKNDGEKIYPIFLSEEACALFGFTKNEYDLRIASGKLVNYMPNPKEVDSTIVKLGPNKERLIIQKVLVQKKDGTPFLLRFVGNIYKYNDKKYCFASLRDVTDEINENQRLTYEAEKYKIINEKTNIITFDYSPKTDVLTMSHHSRNQKNGTQVFNYLKYVDKNSRSDEEGRELLKSEFERALKKARTNTIQLKLNLDFKGFKWYKIKYISLDDSTGVYRVVGRLEDINDLVLMQEKFKDSAEIDTLTKIGNKNYLRNKISETLSDKPNNRKDALFFLDIDNFKEVNDSLGHIAGDKTLSKIGAMLKSIFCADDIIGRFGGDEFIAYIKDIKSNNDLEIISNKILKNIHSIKFKNGLILKTSIGAAILEGKAFTYTEAVKKADKALYAAKNSGKDKFIISL